MFKVENYAAELAAAGFVQVESQDLKEEFNRIHKTELKAFVSTREHFVKEFSKKDFDSITSNWTERVRANMQYDSVALPSFNEADLIVNFTYLNYKLKKNVRAGV